MSTKRKPLRPAKPPPRTRKEREVIVALPKPRPTQPTLRVIRGRVRSAPQ